MNVGNIKGLRSELIAAQWLLDHDYEVFFGFGNTSCDIIALDDDIPIRVEVKTASNHNGARNKWLVAEVDPSKFDILLVVLPDGTVLVNPTMDEVHLGSHKRVRRNRITGHAPQGR